jgi:hypothetical protein
MLRLLIKDITVVKGPERKLLRLQIRWQGSATEVVELWLPANRPDAVRYPTAVIERVRDLAREHDDTEIAALFNRESLTSSTGKPFTVSMISWIRFKHRIPVPPRPAGTLSVNEVCEVRGQHACRVLLDRTRPRIGSPEKTGSALRHHHLRNNRSPTARLGCNTLSHTQWFPNSARRVAGEISFFSVRWMAFALGSTSRCQ